MIAAAAIRHDSVTSNDRPFGYVGLYIETSGRLIVGFCAVFIEQTTNGFLIAPVTNHIADRNAQAVPSRPMDGMLRDPMTGPALVEELLDAHRDINSPLLVPALVR
jgi:hypothetical protein